VRFQVRLVGVDLLSHQFSHCKLAAGKLGGPNRFQQKRLIFRQWGQMSGLGKRLAQIRK
jgi:hypothetical protein